MSNYSFNFIFNVDKDMYDHATLSNINGFWTLLVKYLYRPTETKTLFSVVHEEKPIIIGDNLKYTEKMFEYYNRDKPEIMEINTTKYEAFRRYFNRWVFLKNNPAFKIIINNYFNEKEYLKNVNKILGAYDFEEEIIKNSIENMTRIRNSIIENISCVYDIYDSIYRAVLIMRRIGNITDQQCLDIFDKLYELVLDNYWANNSSELWVKSSIYSDKIRTYLTPIKTVKLISPKDTQSDDKDFFEEKTKRDNVLQTFNRGFIKSLSNLKPQIILYSTLIGNTILSVTGNKELENYITVSSRKVVLPDNEFKPLQLNDLSDVHEVICKAYDLLLHGSQDELKQLCEKLELKFKANNLEKTVASIVYGCSKESLTDGHKGIINIITRMLKRLKKNKVSLEEYRADMDFANSDEYAEANRFLHGEQIEDIDEVEFTDTDKPTEQEVNNEDIVETNDESEEDMTETKEEIEDEDNFDYEDFYEDDEDDDYYEDDEDDEDNDEDEDDNYDDNGFSYPESFTDKDKEQDKLYGETLYPEEQYLNDISTTFITKKKWIDEERLRNLIEKHELRNWSLSDYIEQAKEFIQKHNIKEITPNILEEMFLVDGNNYYHWSKKYFKDGKVETFLKELDKGWSIKHTLGKMLGRISFKPDTDIKSFKTIKNLAVYESQISRIHALVRKNEIKSEWLRGKATSYPIFTARAIMRKLNAENVDYLRHVFNIPEKKMIQGLKRLLKNCMQNFKSLLYLNYLNTK